MSKADQVVKSICQFYAKTVNASDAVAYSKLFTTDVIWMQPGTPIRHGRDEIVADFGGALYQRSLIRTHAPICACRGT